MTDKLQDRKETETGKDRKTDMRRAPLKQTETERDRNANSATALTGHREMEMKGTHQSRKDRHEKRANETDGDRKRKKCKECHSTNGT